MKYKLKRYVSVFLVVVSCLTMVLPALADTRDERVVFNWNKNSPYDYTRNSRLKENNSGVYFKTVKSTLPGRGFYINAEYSGPNGVYTTEWYLVNDYRAYVISSNVPGGVSGTRVTINTWYPSEWGYNWGDVTVDWSPDYTPSGATEIYLPVKNLPVSSTADNIVNSARSYVGKVPYVYGGNTPSGWDCSGFACYVYNLYGINLWPWRGSLKKSTLGTFTSLTNYNSIPSVCRKGDILIFSGHVAIYSGDGKMIHALNTKYGTVETPATQIWVGSALQGYLRISGVQ